VKASEEQIARSLEGHWQEDLLFVLRQEQDGYEFCQKQMAECDRRLKQYLQQREDRSQGATLPEEKRKERRRKKKKGNAPGFDLRAELFRMTGTDLSQIDGIDVTTAMTILSEAGWDMSKWKTEDHFVSWLRLCPDNRISGGKIRERSAPDQQQSNPCPKDGGQHLAAQQHLLGGPVSSTQN
jgi:transposase